MCAELVRQRLFLLTVLSIIALRTVFTFKFMPILAVKLRLGRRWLFSQGRANLSSSTLTKVPVQNLSFNTEKENYCAGIENSVYNKLLALNVPPNGNILLSVSGGADSMAMLHILKSIQARYLPDMKLKVMNINHRQREEAAEEAQFVERWAKQYELDVTLDTVPDSVSSAVSNFQEVARNYRRETCLKLLKKSFPVEELTYSYICLAHHLDDEMETLMLKFLRGVHISNFSAMEGVMGHFLRPLLHLGKEQLVRYLLSRGLDWREDSSNQSRNYKRNKVRLDLLPLLEELAGGKEAFQKRMLSFVEQSQEVRQFMTRMSRELSRQVRYQKYPMYYCMGFDESFFTAPSIVVCDLLNQWIIQCTSIHAGHALIQQIYEKILERDSAKASNISLPDWDIRVVHTELRLSSRRQPPVLLDRNTLLQASYKNRKVNMQISHPAHITVEVFQNCSGITPTAKSPSSHIVPIVLSNNTEANGRIIENLKLVLRYRREGDVFSPGPRMRPVKVTTVMRDLKIPLPLRDRVLVLGYHNAIRNSAANKTAIEVEEKDEIIAVVAENQQMKVHSGPITLTHLLITYNDS